MSYLDTAKEVINNEIKGIEFVRNKLSKNFDDLIETIHKSDGRVVMCGMGKSGHIAKKIFATFVSTGTPSMFMHPSEAFHGDLGMIKPEDIFFAISNSGETNEIVQLLPFIKENGNKLISMTGNQNSTLSKLSHCHLDIGVKSEACPLNLAPTTSTTVSLVLGDAIAVALMKANGFNQENFAKFHPGGTLGRKLLMNVSDNAAKAVYINANDTMLEILAALASSTSGLVIVGSPDDFKGIITDGDIKKSLSEYKQSIIFTLTANDLMTRNPITISSETKCTDADLIMEKNRVNSLILLNDNVVVGIYGNLNK
jgi:arabinose-5-phosphate isomerase